MQHFGHHFRVLHWCTAGLLNEAVAEFGLTASQGRILGYIANQSEAPCAKDLEDFFHLSHPSISGVLKRLEQKGFLEFRCDEEDRRCRRIYLLPKGIECHANIVSQIECIESQITRGFSPEEQSQFRDFLNRAILNLGDNPCPPSMKEETEND